MRTARKCGLLAAVLFSSLPLACLDLSPRKAGTSTTDAGHADGAHVPGPCESCLFGASDREPTCEEPIAVCAADPRCSTLLECLLEIGCFEALKGEEAARCGVPCYLEIGLSSPEDPAITPVFDMAGCSETKCPGICFPVSRDAAAP